MADTMQARREIGFVPRGLRREDAALYLGLRPTKFDQLVREGRMPPPVRLDGCVIWDVKKLDAAFDDLSDPRNDWDG